jgi:hypothetical protein
VAGGREPEPAHGRRPRQRACAAPAAGRSFPTPHLSPQLTRPSRSPPSPTPPQDGNTDYESMRKAIANAKAVTDKPSFIKVTTLIGYGSPNKADTHDVHGAPLGPEETAATRANLKWEYPEFEVPKVRGARPRSTARRRGAGRAVWAASSPGAGNARLPVHLPAPASAHAPHPHPHPHPTPTRHPHPARTCTTPCAPTCRRAPPRSLSGTPRWPRTSPSTPRRPRSSPS